MFRHVELRRIRAAAVAVGVAALLAVAGCDDEPAPPSPKDVEVPTLERTAPGLP